MKAVLQRVSRASVTVDGQIVGAIDGWGFMILLGVEQGDTEKDSSYLAQKSTELRIFNDQAGKMNLSLMESKAVAWLFRNSPWLPTGARGAAWVHACRSTG